MFGDDAYEFVPACLGEELFGIAHDARGEANDILFGRYKRLKESFTASKRQAFELDAFEVKEVEHVVMNGWATAGLVRGLQKLKRGAARFVQCHDFTVQHGAVARELLQSAHDLGEARAEIVVEP